MLDQLAKPGLDGSIAAGAGVDWDARPPIVGRARELATIGAVLDRVEAGESARVAVVGEAGIGKSRLLEVVCDLAGERGHLVARGRALEFERRVPYAFVIDALERALAEAEPDVLRARDGFSRAELRFVVPSVASGDEGPPPSSP